jgi:hypothetical protein
MRTASKIGKQFFSYLYACGSKVFLLFLFVIFRAAGAENNKKYSIFHAAAGI